MHIQTQQIAVISTSHLMIRDAQIIEKLLKEKKGGLTGMALESGLMLSTAPLGEVAELSVPAIKPLVEFFAEKGFDWVLFDNYANEVESLPVYEW